jgi:hypothetical protein
MRPRRSLFVLFAIFGIAIPALAVTGPTPDELDRNRRLLDVWRNDPDHYARLRRDLKSFWEMSPDDRERLRRIDHDLHETDTKTQKKLMGVLERYASWLDRISEAERKQIAASDRSERIKVIRTILDRQYLESLPKRTRDEISQLPVAEQRTQLDRFRREDRQLRLACARFTLLPAEPARRPVQSSAFRPTRLQDFPTDVRYYVDHFLWPQIAKEEAEQIKKAEGAPWPLLARTIWDLSVKHPIKLPGPGVGTRTHGDLMRDLGMAMPMKTLLPAQRKKLNELAGQWPEFAIEFTNFSRKNGVSLPHQLGPCTPLQFDPAVSEFIDRTLMPKLSKSEKDELKSVQGRWPDYPRMLLELSKKHTLEIPYMHLPGSKELWDQARSG